MQARPEDGACFFSSMVEPHRDLWVEKHECFIHSQDEVNVLCDY